MAKAYKNHIISVKKIREFLKDHPEHAKSEAALLGWYRTALRVPWTNFARVRKTFASVDVVGDFVVFNIAGNKIRLVARIRYNLKPRVIYIHRVLTHAEYDEVDLKG